MPSFFAQSVYECDNTKQLIQFYHATMGNPVLSTWCKAIDAGYFRGWPGLTSKRVRKYIKVSEPTEMGHMDQRRTGIRSTKTTDTEGDSMEQVQHRQTTTATTSTRPLLTSMGNFTATKQAVSQSLRTEATVTL